MEPRTNHDSGQIIIELLIAFGLAAILLPALLTGLVGARSGKVQQQQRILAIGLLKEGEEAIRSIREAGWTNITTPAITMDSPHHPVVDGSLWKLESGAETLGDFTRSVVVSDVSPADPSLKKITVTVSWNNILPTDVATTFYLARWKNLSFSDSQTVEPSTGGFGDWCTPVGPSVTNVDLDRQGHPTSLRAFETTDGSGNRVLAGTGANSSGPAFTNIKIIGNSPPTATILGDYNGSPQVKVNGLIGDGRYVFLATDNRGVEILDLATTPYQKIGSFNPSGMKKVNDTYVVGNTGYAVTEDKFYIFSISSDRQTTGQIGVLSLAGGVRVMVDSSNLYAYVPNPDSSGELKIIDVHSHPTNLTLADVKNVDVDGGAGRDVFINAGANRAYLATAYSPTKPEFFIIDITDKANPIVFGSNATYDTGGMDPQGVVVVSGNRAIIVGTDAIGGGAHEYQVFVVTGDAVSFCPNHSQNTDFLNIDSGVFALASVLQSDGHAYSYIATGDSDAELKIIEGGPGGGGPEGSGVYESATFPIPDPGHDVVFNSFTGTSDPNLSYKISIKHGAGGSCSGVGFTDSDFTSFIPGPLPLGTLGSGYVNPGECLRYRAINLGQTPIVFTITFNYSP